MKYGEEGPIYLSGLTGELDSTHECTMNLDRLVHAVSGSVTPPRLPHERGHTHSLLAPEGLDVLIGLRFALVVIVLGA